MANTSHIRSLNQRQVVKALVRQQQASRAELAKLTGMSQPTIGRIVDDLIAGRILNDAETVADPAQLGRPSQRLQLDHTRNRFLAVQLGVKSTRLAVLPTAIASTDRWDVEIATEKSAPLWAGSVTAEAKQLPVRDVEFILLSVPGVVDEPAGRVLLSPNLPWSQDVPLIGLLKPLKRLGKSPALLIVQEIRALALGHLAVESAARDFLLVDFGNGVGAAAVVGGELYHSNLALSGELGHTPVLGNPRECGCGSIGCVETLVSRDGLLLTAGRIAPKINTWQHLLDHVNHAGLEPWLIQAIDAIAVTIAGALNVMGLRRVVLTGSITEFPPRVSEYLSESIVRGAMWARFGKIEVATAPRRRTAGLVSAAIDRVLLG